MTVQLSTTGQCASAARAPWQPILHDPPARDVREVVRAIARDIERRVVPAQQVDHSLAGGSAGIALFFAYLNQAIPDSGYDELARAHLDRSLELLSVVAAPGSLYSGFFGTAWVAAHLDAGLLESDSPVDLCEVDEGLLQLLASNDVRHYDLISGLVGLAIYAVERLPRQSAYDSLEIIALELDRRALKTDAGITWHSGPDLLPPRQSAVDPMGHVDLGVAHGVLGPIAVLSTLQRLGIDHSRSELSTREACRWLLAQRLKDDSIAAFSYSCGGAGEQSAPSRLAWCYGDLGIGAVLHGVGATLADHSLEAVGRELVLGAGRRALASSQVHDASLCHGTAGVAHILNRLAQTTDDGQLLDAAKQWLKHTLALRSPDVGIGGFEYLRSPRVFEATPGFLEGAAGVGLSLLASISGAPPDWDRLLLLSAKRIDASTPAESLQPRER